MLGMGPMEVAVILLVALLFLGPQKMVQGAKTLGDLVSQMRKVTQTITDIDIDKELLSNDKSGNKAGLQTDPLDEDESVDGQKMDNPVPYNRKKKNAKSEDSVDNYDREENNTGSEG